MRYCSGVNKDEIIKFECIQMDIEKIILNKVISLSFLYLFTYDIYDILKLSEQCRALIRPGKIKSCVLSHLKFPVPNLKTQQKLL